MHPLTAVQSELSLFTPDVLHNGSRTPWTGSASAWWRSRPSAGDFSTARARGSLTWPLATHAGACFGSSRRLSRRTCGLSNRYARSQPASTPPRPGCHCRGPGNGRSSDSCYSSSPSARGERCRCRHRAELGHARGTERCRRASRCRRLQGHRRAPFPQARVAGATSATVIRSPRRRTARRSSRDESQPSGRSLAPAWQRVSAATAARRQR